MKAQTILTTIILTLLIPSGVWSFAYSGYQSMSGTPIEEKYKKLSLESRGRNNHQVVVEFKKKAKNKKGYLRIKGHFFKACLKYRGCSYRYFKSETKAKAFKKRFVKSNPKHNTSILASNVFLLRKNLATKNKKALRNWLINDTRLIVKSRPQSPLRVILYFSSMKYKGKRILKGKKSAYISSIYYFHLRDLRGPFYNN